MTVEMKRRGFPGGSDSEESACDAGDLGSILGSRRSPREGNGYPLLYSCPRKSHGQRSLFSYSPWLQRVGHDCASITFQTYLRNILRPNNKCTNRLIRCERNGEM